MKEAPAFWTVLSVVLIIGLALALSFLWRLRAVHRLEGDWLKRLDTDAGDDPHVRAIQQAQRLSDRVSAHDEWFRNVLSVLGALGVFGGVLFTWHQFRET